ncbi:HutD/Ves family protein [Streptomyces sp. A1-5]|uniref:HutD/Ves family protein n=1 Tax=Streptomyces sp. A1-5 TaxID=2738410 RepID=UPI001F1784F6|nr:HutD family protein [Streptomyces sp. A1-5]UJB43967.1 HutD family protein [Streptomyces sp. A1-5]
MRILRADGRAAVPWRNGGGFTREVAAHPPGAGWDAFAWRVSLAEVTRDGPYSPLPGVRRILTVVDGAGLELTVDGAVHPLPGRYRPFAFPGAAATDCQLLDGPVVNLNVMVREGRTAARVTMVRGIRELTGARTAVVVALDGGTRIDAAVAGEPGVRLARYDAAVWEPTGDAAVPAVVRTDGVAAVIELSDVVPDAPSDVNGSAGTGR